MSIAITKPELVQKIKQSLGWPTIDLELEESTYDWAIDRGIEKYTRHAFGTAVVTDWYLLSCSSGVSAYDAPTNITSILQWQLGTDYLAGNVSELFTFENLMWNMGALNVWNWGNFGLVSYHMALANIDLIRKMIPSQYTVRYDRAPNQIYVNPAPKSNTTLWIQTYVTVPPSALWEDDWVYDWARAECKEVLGLIRSKFTSLPGPGGNINLNGTQLMAQADTEKKDLMVELLQGRSQPLSFKIG